MRTDPVRVKDPDVQTPFNEANVTPGFHASDSLFPFKRIVAGARTGDYPKN